MAKQKHGEKFFKFDFSRVDGKNMSPVTKELEATIRDCQSRGRAYYCPRCRHYHGTDVRSGLSLCSTPALQGGWVVDEIETENGVEPMALCVNFESTIER
jgi:hypothetical protein